MAPGALGSLFLVDNAGTGALWIAAVWGLSYWVSERREGTDRRVGTTSARPSGPR
jgi:hypothetical protein